ncbi:hypothetical protein ACFQ05_19720 [Amycolatopsis umgeniensis]|uniref:Glyoxalase-like domain-containing protein n=1 Tax=Amycolatopsis umgeniensis TaxID=336628 RepID=A0A841BG15_9PSEU|nr:hypothetical protein [Amycolatopsis umgeniensis]MBB5857841.1 hypothetical protein [Amycolatopsis umgeniensis]
MAHAPEAAGQGSVVIGVEDVDELAALGVECGSVQDYDFVKLSDAVDPEGNKISFVWENPNYQPPSD